MSVIGFTGALLPVCVCFDRKQNQTFFTDFTSYGFFVSAIAGYTLFSISVRLLQSFNGLRFPAQVDSD